MVVAGDDFTVRGGAADAAIWQKQVYSEQMADELRIPLVRLVDGTGGGGSVKSLETDRRTYVPALPGWQHVVDNLATVPVVASGSGSVAGLGAARVVASHYSLMVRDTSQMFVGRPAGGGPASGATITKEAAGRRPRSTGATGWWTTWSTARPRPSSAARRFLSYLPSSVDELPPRAEPTDDPERADEWLAVGHPRDRPARSTRCAASSRRWSTPASWFEIGPRWGGPRSRGLARLDGWPVAVLASDPYQARRRAGRPTPADKVDPLRGPGRHLPPAGGAPGRPARVHGRASRASGPAPSATGCGP